MRSDYQLRAQLSKSKFVVGVQFLKRLYLQIHEPELAAELDEQTEAILNQGQKVGLLAQKAFPGGVAVGCDDDLSVALDETQRLIGSPEVPAIFEAAFLWQGVVVRVDILKRVPRARWRLIEVKSTTEVKEHHIYDVAIQRHVVSGCGLKVSSSCLVHLNRQYEYDGRQYQPNKLFSIEEVTKAVKKTDRELAALLKDEWRVVKRKYRPDLDPGPQCEHPVVCEFYDQCHDPLPDDYISYLPRISQTKLNTLLDQGIKLISGDPGGLSPRRDGEKGVYRGSAGEDVGE